MPLKTKLETAPFLLPLSFYSYSCFCTLSLNEKRVQQTKLELLKPQRNWCHSPFITTKFLGLRVQHDTSIHICSLFAHFKTTPFLQFTLRTNRENCNKIYAQPHSLAFVSDKNLHFLNRHSTVVECCLAMTHRSMLCALNSLTVLYKSIYSIHTFMLP